MIDDLTPEQMIERAEHVRAMLSGPGWAHAKALIDQTQNELFKLWLNGGGVITNDHRERAKVLSEFVDELHKLADDSEAKAMLEQMRRAQEERALELEDNRRADAEIQRLRS